MIRLDKNQYNKIQIGSNIQVAIKQGYFGFNWIENEWIIKYWPSVRYNYDHLKNILK